MSAYSKISTAYANALNINIDNSSKIVLMSDCHRGDGNNSDSFANNQNLYFSAMKYYFEGGYTYIELGDGDELWKYRKFCQITEQNSHAFWLLNKFYTQKRLHLIYGNHDIVKRGQKWIKNNLYNYREERSNKLIPLFPNIKTNEAIVLNYNGENEIVLLHGHQADSFNSTLWKVSRFLVRYFWTPLESLGVNDPTRAAKNYKKKGKVERKLAFWAKKEKKMIVAGHTHRPMFPNVGEPLYFNDGSAVHPRCITAIEIDDGKITLVKWSVQIREDKTLYVSREILAGPSKLSEYFENL